MNPRCTDRDRGVLGLVMFPVPGDWYLMGSYVLFDISGLI